MQRNGFISRFTSTGYGQLICVLLLFAVLRVLSSAVFFDGFLHSFGSLNRLLFGKEAGPAVFGHLPYGDGSILFSALLHPVFLAALLLLYLPWFWAWKKKLPPHGFSGSERVIAGVAALLLAWELCTYDYNYYLDRAFYADRIVLLLLALSLFRLPAIAPLFLAFAFVYRSQFNYPAGGFPLFDKRLLFDLLVMLISVRYVRLLIPDLKKNFLFFALAIVAANYFASGAAKLMISPHGTEWVFGNRLENLFMNVHLRGWRAEADDATIAGIRLFLSRFGVYFQVAVLLLELGAVFVLRSRKTALLLLPLLGLMHLGIFYFGSMLFWKWMLIDFTLAAVLFFDRRPAEAVFAGKKTFLPAATAVLLGFAWLQPFTIGWHDTKFNQYFTYEVEDDSGQIYRMEKNAFDPFHQWIQYDQFLFLVDRPCLRVSGFGYTNNYRLAAAIDRAGPAGMAALEQERGDNQYSPSRKQQYEAFMRQYFSNRNRRAGKDFFPARLHAPHHLYNHETGPVYEGQFRVSRFRVIFNQTYTQDGKTSLLRKETVSEIMIGP